MEYGSSIARLSQPASRASQDLSGLWLQYILDWLIRQVSCVAQKYMECNVYELIIIVLHSNFASILQSLYIWIEPVHHLMKISIQCVKYTKHTIILPNNHIITYSKIYIYTGCLENNTPFLGRKGVRIMIFGMNINISTRNILPNV